LMHGLFCDTMRMVIALGGNAIKKATERGTAEEQIKNVRETCECLWKLFRDHDIVITHGNGPQVGSILIQQESGEPYVPGMPLDICVAESQGLIGYLIQQSLRNVLITHGIQKEVVTVISQVAVDEKDPAFRNPTKPVGPFYTKERAEELKNKGISVMEDAGRGYRRVVPSPDPNQVLEADIIRLLLNQGIRLVFFCPAISLLPQFIPLQIRVHQVYLPVDISDIFIPRNDISLSVGAPDQGSALFGITVTKAGMPLLNPFLVDLYQVNIRVTGPGFFTGSNHNVSSVIVKYSPGFLIGIVLNGRQERNKIMILPFFKGPRFTGGEYDNEQKYANGKKM